MIAALTPQLIASLQCQRYLVVAIVVVAVCRSNCASFWLVFVRHSNFHCLLIAAVVVVEAGVVIYVAADTDDSFDVADGHHKLQPFVGHHV